MSTPLPTQQSFEWTDYEKLKSRYEVLPAEIRAKFRWHPQLVEELVNDLLSGALEEERVIAYAWKFYQTSFRLYEELRAHSPEIVEAIVTKKEKRRSVSKRPPGLDMVSDLERRWAGFVQLFAGVLIESIISHVEMDTLWTQERDLMSPNEPERPAALKLAGSFCLMLLDRARFTRIDHSLMRPLALLSARLYEQWVRELVDMVKQTQTFGEMLHKILLYVFGLGELTEHELESLSAEELATLEHLLKNDLAPPESDLTPQMFWVRFIFFQTFESNLELYQELLNELDTIRKASAALQNHDHQGALRVLSESSSRFDISGILNELRQRLEAGQPISLPPQPSTSTPPSTRILQKLLDAPKPPQWVALDGDEVLGEDKNLEALRARLAESAHDATYFWTGY